MFEPYQLFVDVSGVSYCLLKPMPVGFWLAIRVSYVPQLHVFSTANLRRMLCIGKITLGPA